eukprot:g2811.t1
MIGAKGDQPAGFDGWLSRSARKSKRLADRLEEKRRAMYERELDECTFQPELVARGSVARAESGSQKVRKKKKKKKKKELPPSYYRSFRGNGTAPRNHSYQDMFTRTRRAVRSPNSSSARDEGGEKEEQKRQQQQQQQQQSQLDEANLFRLTGSAGEHSHTLTRPPLLEPSPLLPPSSPPPLPSQLDEISLRSSPPSQTKSVVSAVVTETPVPSESSKNLAQLGSLFQCAWEGIISHESGVPRPAPHILGTESAAPPKELSYLQSKISSTLANRDESGEAHGGDSDAAGQTVRKQSLRRSRLSRYLADTSSSIDWEDVRAIQAERQRATTDAQRKRIQGMRREREKVYRRLLNFYRERMSVEGFQVDNFTSSEPVPRDFAQHTPESS